MLSLMLTGTPYRRPSLWESIDFKWAKLSIITSVQQLSLSLASSVCGESNRPRECNWTTQCTSSGHCILDEHLTFRLMLKSKWSSLWWVGWLWRLNLNWVSPFSGKRRTHLQGAGSPPVGSASADVQKVNGWQNRLHLDAGKQQQQHVEDDEDAIETVFDECTDEQGRRHWLWGPVKRNYKKKSGYFTTN